MMLSEIKELPKMVGRRVKTLMGFSGVPAGTEGTIADYYCIGPDHEGVMIQWDLPMHEWEKPLQDGFGRCAEIDETKWLELI